MKHSYGLVPYRISAEGIEVLIGHLGGPLWASRNERAWSFPKGLPEPDETPLETARREFEEELGIAAPTGGFIELGDVTQSGGKRVTAWAVECGVDLEDFSPGMFELQWPPRSGRYQQFPEIDRIAWCTPEQARPLLVSAQTAFVDRLEALLLAG